MVQSLTLGNIRHKLAKWTPTSMLGKLALYFALLRLGVAAVETLLVLFVGPTTAAALNALATILDVLFVIFFLMAIFTWIRRRMLWRLRNRLIVTYIFIGVIPVVLIVLMVGIASYLFANQYATSQARLEIESQLQNLRTISTGITAQIVDEWGTRGPKRANLIPSEVKRIMDRYPGIQVIASLDDGSKQAVGGSGPKLEVPAWVKGNFQGIVREQGALYLRYLELRETPHGKLMVQVSQPLNNKTLETAGLTLGAIKIYLPKPRLPGDKDQGITLTYHGDGDRAAGESESRTRAFNFRGKADIAGGAVPPASSWRWDPVMNFASASPYRDWRTGEESLQDPAILQITTRPSTLVTRLFSTMGELAEVELRILGIIAVFLALIELGAIFFGVGLTRTVTTSVSNLYRATQHINQGDLKYRISVRSNDQLAALQLSFNSMAESLEKLLEQQKEKERLENELAIAHEVQETLFPRAVVDMKNLEVHGTCKPARTVSGDYFDFLTAGAASEQLAIAVGDISGKGISAALLMATLHSAVRAYEFGSSNEEPLSIKALSGEGGDTLTIVRTLQSPASVMELLNRHLYRSTQPEKYATLFLGVYDGETQALTYTNAGHLPPLVMHRDGSVTRLDAVGNTVIGLFEEVSYDECTIHLAPGDIFIAFSDGITEPENEFGEFGESGLLDVIHANRHLPLARISELVTAAVKDWIGAQEQPDDMTLVLARAL